MLIVLPDGKQTLISTVLLAQNAGKLVTQCGPGFLWHSSSLVDYIQQNNLVNVPNGLPRFNPRWNFNSEMKFQYLEVLDIRRPSGLIQWTSGSGSPFALHFRLAG